MKTLFININSSDKTNKDNVEVVKYDFLNDFYYALGEAIAQGRASSVNKSDLVLDYKKDTLTTRFTDILKEAELFKRRLWGKDLSEKCTICLPDEYLSWLRYNSNDVYRAIYETGFSTGNCEIVLDLQDFYEYSELKRSIWKYLKSRDIKEIIFSDTGITEESYIVHEIHENFPEVEYIQFDLWKGSQERLEQEKLAAEKAAKEEEERKRRELEEAKRKDEEERKRREEEIRKLKEKETVLKTKVFPEAVTVELSGLKFKVVDYPGSSGIKIVNKTQIPDVIVNMKFGPILRTIWSRTEYRSLLFVLKSIPWDTRFRFDEANMSNLFIQAFDLACERLSRMKRYAHEKALFNESINQKLFPIYGNFVLGKTSVSDLLSPTAKDFFNQSDRDKITMSFHEMIISQEYCDEAFTVLEIPNGVDYPEKWKQELGFNTCLSLKGIIKLLHDRGFILHKLESPYRTSFPMVVAYTPDTKYQLIFTYQRHFRTKWGCELLHFKMIYHKESQNIDVTDVYEKYLKEWSYYDF